MRAVAHEHGRPDEAHDGEDEAPVEDELHPPVHVLRRAVAGALVVGALRVDEPQEDRRPKGRAGLAEGGGDPVAGGARLGRENLGGDLWCGVVCWWLRGVGVSRGSVRETERCEDDDNPKE